MGREDAGAQFAARGQQQPLPRVALGRREKSGDPNFIRSRTANGCGRKRSYRVEPLLVEALVDPRRHRGTCYRAANWIDLGLTSGLGRMDRRRSGEEVAPKTVLVYAVAHDAAQQLRES